MQIPPHKIGIVQYTSINFFFFSYNPARKRQSIPTWSSGNGEITDFDF